jgi:F420-0:gamma-glutamyl ligase
MKITGIKTRIITSADNLLALIDEYAPHLPDRSVIAVTSKIVSVCEGRIIPVTNITHEALIRQESDYYRAPSGATPGHYHLTIKSGLLVGSAGIDQSNGNGHYILWPADPQATANQLRRHLSARTGHPHLGVIITDSRSTPLRRGATGLSLAHSGFAALQTYAGHPDIYGQPLQSEVANLVDALAVAAVAVMGEGDQSTPLAIIEDVGFLEFQDHDPTPHDISELKVPIAEDFFSEFLQTIPWDKQPSS